MTAEEVIVAVVRLLGALPVLRWALAGGLIAILVDLSDLFLKNYLDLGGVRHYQEFDKWLDQAYMAAFLAVALRWPGRPRAIAAGLYAFRMAGFVAFELTGARWLLFLFPNVFEFWFLFAAGQRRFRPAFAYSAGPTAATLAALTALKLVQEYALHIGQWLDSFTTKDVVGWVIG